MAMIGLAWLCAGAVAQDYAQVKPGVCIAIPARPRQPSAVPHRVVVRHRLGEESGRHRARLPDHVLPQPPALAEANPSRFAPRQLLFAHAALADPRSGRLLHDQRAARAGFGLAEAKRRATPTCGSTTGRCSRRRRRLQRQDCGARFRARARIQRHPAAAAAGRARLEPQGAAARAGELLLQPAAARRVRQRSTVKGEQIAVSGTRLARPRMVERIPGDRKPRAGTGSASTSTTAAR